MISKLKLKAMSGKDKLKKGTQVDPQVEVKEAPKPKPAPKNKTK
jgi:hypothetical protein